MVKTVKCKLIVAEDQALALTETMVRFAAACNELSNLLARQPGLRRHTFELQKFYYHYLKQTYGLTSNYAIRVCDRVAHQIKGKQFRPTSITFDKDLFRYVEKAEEATVSTVSGRIRIKLSLGEYQRDLLRGFKFGAGTISYDRRTNGFFANICIDVPEVPGGGRMPLGVDLGINRIATTSTGLVISGRDVNRKREKFARTKASLQRKGTKGSKRTLKRLSGRERRFQKSINHQISRRVVDLAKETDSYIVLEDLKGIRERTHKHGRHHRRRMGRWAFHQLRSFIGYKAAESGVRVVLVDPRNTSKSCSNCGALGVRRKHRFSCTSCGFVADADVQAAINIAAKGLQANQPEVAGCFER